MIPSAVRRTGSMEARKGSACAFPEEVVGGFGERRVNSWGLCSGPRGSDEEGNDAAELVGVGGQFPDGSWTR